MSALLVGADRLGNIKKTLQENGIDNFIHWQGRKKGMRKLDIPDVDLVIVFTDFLEHNLCLNVKEKAKKNKIKCIYSKRSSLDLDSKLKKNVSQINL